MNLATFETQGVHGGRLVLVITGLFLFICVSMGALASTGPGFSEARLLASIVVLFVVLIGGFILALQRFVVFRVSYALTERGIREERRTSRGAAHSEPELPWSEVGLYVRDTDPFSGSPYLNVSSRDGKRKLRIWAGKDAVAAERFDVFCKELHAALEKWGAPASAPEALRGTPFFDTVLARVLAVLLLAAVLGLGAYVLSLPPEERPDFWQGRLLVLASFILPFVTRVLGRRGQLSKPR
jgi:hypothetical protein